MSYERGPRNTLLSWIYGRPRRVEQSDTAEAAKQTQLGETHLSTASVLKKRY